MRASKQGRSGLASSMIFLASLANQATSSSGASSSGVSCSPRSARRPRCGEHAALNPAVAHRGLPAGPPLGPVQTHGGRVLAQVNTEAGDRGAGVYPGLKPAQNGVDSATAVAHNTAPTPIAMGNCDMGDKLVRLRSSRNWSKYRPNFNVKSRKWLKRSQNFGRSDRTGYGHISRKFEAGVHSAQEPLTSLSHTMSAAAKRPGLALYRLLLRSAKLMDRRPALKGLIQTQVRTETGLKCWNEAQMVKSDAAKSSRVRPRWRPRGHLPLAHLHLERLLIPCGRGCACTTDKTQNGSRRRWTRTTKRRARLPRKSQSSRVGGDGTFPKQGVRPLLRTATLALSTTSRSSADRKKSRVMVPVVPHALKRSLCSGCVHCERVGR